MTDHQRPRAGGEERLRKASERLGARPPVRAGGIACGQDDEIRVELQSRNFLAGQNTVEATVGRTRQRQQQRWLRQPRSPGRKPCVARAIT